MFATLSVVSSSCHLIPITKALMTKALSQFWFPCLLMCLLFRLAFSLWVSKLSLNLLKFTSRHFKSLLKYAPPKKIGCFIVSSKTKLLKTKNTNLQSKMTTDSTCQSNASLHLLVRVWAVSGDYITLLNPKHD